MKEGTEWLGAFSRLARRSFMENRNRALGAFFSKGKGGVPSRVLPGLPSWLKIEAETLRPRINAVLVLSFEWAYQRNLAQSMKAPRLWMAKPCSQSDALRWRMAVSSRRAILYSSHVRVRRIA